MTGPITFAANQGEMGGGEVMLLTLAEAARELGHDVRVVGPQEPGELVDAARDRGFPTTALPGHGTPAYLVNLRRWNARTGGGLLWCNGLRPALATALHPRRVVHLHQVPVGKLAMLARVARVGALATVVPSRVMARVVRGSVALENWTPEIPRVPVPTFDRPVTIGYLGRLSSDKGVPVLAEAVRRLAAAGHDVMLLVAGESRFVAPADAQRVDDSLNALGDRVDRRGWMRRDDFFRAVDLAVFPSVWAEPFGLVAAEAMAAGCPFVVSDAGALPEVAGADYPFIARHDDAAHLAETIERALGARWPELVHRSRERWEQHFSPAAGRERLATFLTSVTAEGASA